MSCIVLSNRARITTNEFHLFASEGLATTDIDRFKIQSWSTSLPAAKHHQEPDSSEIVICREGILHYLSPNDPSMRLVSFQTSTSLGRHRPNQTTLFPCSLNVGRSGSSHQSQLVTKLNAGQKANPTTQHTKHCPASAAQHNETRTEESIYLYQEAERKTTETEPFPITTCTRPARQT